jgi:hypothetical protein
MILIVPENRLTKTHKIIARIIAIIVIFILLALACWGIVLIVEFNNINGVIPLSIAVVISLTQIILGIIFYKKNHE